VRFEFGLHACKILSGSVNVCQSYSRKADFEQIHITLSCICMTAYNNVKPDCKVLDLANLYILNVVRCPYVRTSLTLGMASSVANDVIMRTTS